METFYFEITDTFGGEANYSWVNRFKVNAKNLRGALIKISRHTGLNFRYDGYRYNAKKACICMFELEYSIKNYKFEEI